MYLKMAAVFVPRVPPLSYFHQTTRINNSKQWHYMLRRWSGTDVLVSQLVRPVHHCPIPDPNPYPLLSPLKLTHPASVTPNEGELFKRFSPELQKHNLENRERRQRDYEDFVGKLKEYSKSDKPSMPPPRPCERTLFPASRALHFRMGSMTPDHQLPSVIVITANRVCLHSMGSRCRSAGKGAGGIDPAAGT
jgi:hypothetical protein